MKHKQAGFIFFSAVGFALLLGLTFSVGVAKAEKVTGCLTKSGQLKKLALGDTPRKPCKKKETQVTLGSEGVDELPTAVGTKAVVVDSDGNQVGTLVGVGVTLADPIMPGPVTVARVLLDINDHQFVVQVGQERFFGSQSLGGVSAFGPVFFDELDCDGSAFVPDVRGILPSVFVNQPDNRVYVESPGSVPMDVSVQSKLARPSPGGCLNSSFEVLGVLPATAVVDLDDLFTPPFTLRLE